jgi:hypothetical protein
MGKTGTAEQTHGFNLLEKILGREDARPISEKLLAKIITSSRDEPDILEIVLRHNTHPIDESFLKTAVQIYRGSEVVRLILSYYTNSFISEDVMLEAVKKYDSAVVEVLLSQGDDQPPVETLRRASYHGRTYRPRG